GGDKDAVLVAYPSEAKGGEKRTFFDYRRRGKAVKILIGGMIFAGLYFIFFSSFNWAFPGYSEQAWSFQIFSGMKIFGVPIKGVFPFFILGIIWSGFYECLTWRAIKRSG
ncbi:MAG: hypothetical protein Q7S82_02435, partial [bacterium]|nr:hypothetical protein [bacterium]